MLPSDFVNRMKFMLGRECEAFLASFECERIKALRLNPLKLKEGISKAINILPFETISILWEENGFIYRDEDEPGKNPLHMAGLYYIQEPSAMSPVFYLDPRPGERVLDLCASPGGKSTQIAGRMQGEGILVSNEINSSRAEILSQNIERMGISNALVLNETPENLSSRFEGWFDRILVDAPCSGEGMFRKNDEAISNWSPENVRLCAQRQDTILDHAASMLAPGGRIVYSTCTFAPDEDEGTIYRFLLSHPKFHVCKVPLFDGMDNGSPKWALVDTSDKDSYKNCDVSDDMEQLSNCIRLWPHHLKGEGHFLAVLERSDDIEKNVVTLPVTYCPGDFQRGIRIEKTEKDEDDTIKAIISKSADINDGSADIKGIVVGNSMNKGDKKLKAKDRRVIERKLAQNMNHLSGGSANNAEAAKLWDEFSKYVLTDIGKSRIYGTLFTFGENVYIAPSIMPSTDKLKVKRPGLHLGTIKKNRFEPSHSLALFLRQEDVKYYIDYASTSQEIKDYTSGLTLSAKLENAWYLITTDGCSIGFAKSDGRRLKNHYPKGLRINYAD